MIAIKAHYDELLSRYVDKKKSVWGGGGAAAQNHAVNLTSEIVNLILSEAVMGRASDVHFEPGHGLYKVRFRVDGKLYDVLVIKESPEINLVPRLKILANLPTDSMSSRKSSDGRFSMDILSQKFDFRIATFPTILGEKIAIRILNKNGDIVDLKKIGLSPRDIDRVDRIIQRKGGLLIVSGPTGAGKTTTLYSILRRLHTPSVNIVTLEDPVEYQIDGINQHDVKNKGNEDFVAGLKAILRQDPDIILIGEIRDIESAEIALRASITGHLVLTSLHANSALGTVMRLINMGLEKHLVSYSLIGTIAQRLLRRICDGCRVPQKVDAQALTQICARFGINPKLFSRSAAKSPESGLEYVSEEQTLTENFTFYKGNGCERCGGTGYYGRIGVFEIVQITEELRDAILRDAPVADLEKVAGRSGFQSMVVDAIQKASSGLIGLDDIYPILLERSS